MAEKKKLKIRFEKIEKGADDMAILSVAKGFGAAQKDFDINIYADSNGIRVDIINENSDSIAEHEWSWEDLIDG